MPQYLCTPGVLEERFEAPHAAAAAVLFFRKHPLSHGQVQTLFVHRILPSGAPEDESTFFDPQECIRLSVAASGKPEWDAMSAMD